MYGLHDDLRWLTRHIEDIQRATRSLPDLESVTRQFEHAQRAAASLPDLASVTRQIDRAQRAARPLRDLAAASRHIENAQRAARPLPDLAAMTREIAGVRPAAQVMPEFHALDRQIAAARWSPFPDFDDLARQIAVIRDWTPVLDAAASVSRLIEANRSAYDRLGGLDPRVEGTAAGTFWLHEKLPSWESLGVLSALGSAPSTGILSWRSRTRTARPGQVHLGTWSDRPREADTGPSVERTVEVACHVTCTFCGSRMFSPGGRLYLSKTGELIVDLPVVPLCPTCDRLANRSPEYRDAFYEELAEYLEDDEPSEHLRLIEGGGEGQEPPRGRQNISLVKMSEADGENDAEDGENDAED